MSTRVPSAAVAEAAEALWVSRGGRADSIRWIVHHDTDTSGTVTPESTSGSPLQSRFTWRFEGGQVIVEPVNW